MCIVIRAHMSYTGRTSAAIGGLPSLAKLGVALCPIVFHVAISHWLIMMVVGVLTSITAI